VGDPYVITTGINDKRAMWLPAERTRIAVTAQSRRDLEVMMGSARKV